MALLSEALDLLRADFVALVDSSSSPDSELLSSSLIACDIKFPGLAFGKHKSTVETKTQIRVARKLTLKELGSRALLVPVTAVFTNLSI